MNFNNFPPCHVQVVNKFPWNHLPDVLTAAKSIPGINISNMREVGSGEMVRNETEVSAYWSSGFRHCSALIMRSLVSVGFDFAHCWPDAQEILRPMHRKDVLVPAEAAFVYGSNSPSQHDLELFLAARGTKLHVINTETGFDGSDFGVLVENQSGLVSVIRENPDKMIFQYMPFE